MRHLAAAVTMLALAACGAPQTATQPVVGEAVAYVQRFRIAERTSDGQELPDVTIEQHVTVTCSSIDNDRARVTIGYGDASVWIEADDGDPAFVAADAGSVARAFDEDEIDMSVAYAALWAVMGHVEIAAAVDRQGVLHDVDGLEEVARRRDGDVAADLGGSLLESLIADPALLSVPRNAAGDSPIRVTLANWKATFDVASTLEERRDGTYTVSYEHDSAAQGSNGGDGGPFVGGPFVGGPFVGLTLTISGAGSRQPDTGMPETRALEMRISGSVPVGTSGALRRDAARITYTLTRADG